MVPTPLQCQEFFNAGSFGARSVTISVSQDGFGACGREIYGLAAPMPGRDLADLSSGQRAVCVAAEVVSTNQWGDCVDGVGLPPTPLTASHRAPRCLLPLQQGGVIADVVPGVKCMTRHAL
jgi:hypothetical protein